MTEIDKDIIIEAKELVVGFDTSKNFCYHLADFDGFFLCVVIENHKGYYTAQDKRGNKRTFESRKDGQYFVDHANRSIGKSKWECAKITLSSMAL